MSPLSPFPDLTSIYLCHFREPKDNRYVREKLTARDAKELFEAALKLEREQKHIFNGMLHSKLLESEK